MLLSMSPASAALIVDTGAPNTSGGLRVYADQWVAGQFTTMSDYNINSVEGWFGSQDGGSAHATIYADNGTGLPFGAALHTQQFTLDAPQVGTSAWDGAYGLNWALAAGTYWLAFEVLAGDTAENYMPNGAPSPLALIGIDISPAGDGYTVSSTFYTPGFRIDATPSAVPVPAAVWLFGTGILGLIGYGKRRSRATV
jgi:hypothetical protein